MSAEIGRFTRLEDFIQLVREGEGVQVSVDLRKLSISQKVHPEDQGK